MSFCRSLIGSSRTAARVLVREVGQAKQHDRDRLATLIDRPPGRRRGDPYALDQHGWSFRQGHRWYLRYCGSYRDVEELLIERGVEVDHVTMYRWVQRFAPLLADAARFTPG